MSKLVFLAAFLLSGLTPKTVLCQKVENSLLWEIKGNGLKTSSYICGTIHSICLSQLRIPKKLKPIIDSVSQIVFEVSIERPKDFSKYYFIKNSSLQKLVGDGYYNKIKQILSRRRLISEDTLQKLSPFVLRTYLTNAAMNCRIVSVEQIIHELGKKVNASFSQLETLEDHEAPVREIPIDSQIEALKYTIDNIDSIVKEDTETADLYIQNDINKIYSDLAFNADGSETNFKQHFLDARNNKWMEKIEQFIFSKSSLIAVGCSHLPGQLGIINLLRRKGYLVIPVNN